VFKANAILENQKLSAFIFITNNIDFINKQNEIIGDLLFEIYKSIAKIVKPKLR
jgi:hypothetical protein